MLAMNLTTISALVGHELFRGHIDDCLDFVVEQCNYLQDIGVAFSFIDEPEDPELSLRMFQDHAWLAFINLLLRAPTGTLTRIRIHLTLATSLELRSSSRYNSPISELNWGLLDRVLAQHSGVVALEIQFPPEEPSFAELRVMVMEQLSPKARQIAQFTLFPGFGVSHYYPFCGATQDRDYW